MEFKDVNDATVVMISKKEYKRLLDRDLMLQCLEQAGIDNAEAYEFGIDSYREAKKRLGEEVEDDD